LLLATEWVHTPLGEKLIIPVGKAHDVVVLCEQTAFGIKPVKVLTSNQVYRHKLDPDKRYLAIPASSSDYIDLTTAH
jgi:hypothetical protein